MESYLIIGAGPGGYELAAAAAAKGNKVTLIERDQPGGTCLNRGCIPTKTMAHAADIINSLSHAPEYGINCRSLDIDFARLSAKRDEVVAQLREGIMAMMRGVDFIPGEAKFISPKEVEVTTPQGETLTLSADKIVIATGSAPSALPITGAENAITSDQLLKINALPKSMVIIGGGVIGLEFASIFNSLGVEVSVVEYCKEILPQFDKDIAKRLRTHLAAAGISFHVGTQVKGIEPYRVIFEQKGKESLLEAEMVVMAVGRRPVFPEGLSKAGVETTRKGISVDPATMLTSAPGIYAIGDVNGLCMLAHAASAQGKVVLGEKINLDVIPSVVFTHPEVAMVGASEQSLKEAAIEYKSAKSLFRANGKAVSMSETSGMVKLLYSPSDGAILGCSIMGPHASDIIEEIAIAMANHLPVSAISSTIHPHPTLCETIASCCNTH